MAHPLDFFHFCPHCGHKDFTVFDACAKRCGHCGFTLYHNASAATVAVITDGEGRLLAVRRACEPAKGTLDLPGGFVCPGETLDEGLAREVKEELGAEVAEWAYLFSQTNVYRYSGYDIHTTDAFFACRLADNVVVTAADDAAEVMWLKPEEIRPEAFGLLSIRQGVEKLLERWAEKGR